MTERRPARPGATVAVWSLAAFADPLTRSFQTEVFFLLPLVGMLIVTVAGLWILIHLLLQATPFIIKLQQILYTYIISLITSILLHGFGVVADKSDI